LDKIVNRFKRVGLMALLLGVMGMSISACGGDTATATPPPQPTATTAPSGNTGGDTAGMQEVKINLKEWAIEPANVEVNAGKVKFTISNSGEFAHDIAIEGLGDSAKIAPFKGSDGPKTIEVDLAAGTYTLVCDIPGHADHGMKGTLTVK
jgi:plastocyanin